MSTLETQYRKFLEANQKLKLSFEEWKKVNARLVKQALINMMKDDEELGLYDEPKQETLEEAGLKHSDILDKFPALINPLFSFKEGAKWQQERSYSEEEVLDIAKQAFILGKDFGLIGTFNEWFEQFRKK
jgi:hypothetical protein